MKYVDVGKHFGGTRPALANVSTIASWLLNISRDSMCMEYEDLCTLFARQLCLNGFESFMLLLIETENESPDMESFNILAYALKTDIKHVVLGMLKTMISTEAVACTCVLSVQGYRDVISNTCLSIRIPVVLLSERAFLLGQRLYGFLRERIEEESELDLEKLDVEDNELVVGVDESAIDLDKDDVGLSGLIRNDVFESQVPGPEFDAYVQIEQDLGPQHSGKWEINEQRIMSRIHIYASSLQGAALCFRPILPAGEKIESGNNKSGKPTKAQLIREENEKRMKEVEISRQRKVLGVAIEMAATGKSLDAKLAALDALRLVKGTCQPLIYASFLVARLDIFAAAWKEDYLNKGDLASSEKQADMRHAVSLFEVLFELIDDGLLGALEPGQMESTVVPCVAMFGFKDAVSQLIDMYMATREVKVKDPVRKKLVGAVSGDKYRVRMSYTRFQLLFCGHLLFRRAEVKKDLRVLFTPDPWQTELLDAVDAGKSALISAPTSSGKTFICYYAMEKVLRASHDGVVVYIAPNKALMNQVVADVYARFGHKQYPPKSNRRLFGFLSDVMSYHPFEAQVLVTFPDAIETYVCSPLYARSFWKDRVKYIILDEIHTIGEEGKGAAWEKIIMAAQCPVLALSATIGKSGAFFEWLKNVQTCVGIECCFIETMERHSDLGCHVYLPGCVDGDRTHNLNSVRRRIEEDGILTALHPVVAVGGVDASGLVLLPGEAVRLYDALNAFWKDKESKKEISFGVPLVSLDYEKLFKSLRIGRDEVREYSSRVLKAFEVVLHNGDLGTDGLTFVLGKLGANDYDRYMNESMGSGMLLDTFLPMLLNMSSEEKLPAIIFHFDRGFCTTLAAHLVAQLERADIQKKTRRLKEEKRTVSELEKQQRVTRRLRDVEGSKSKDAWIETSIASEQLADIENSLGRHVDPDLVFYDLRFKLKDADLSELVSSVYRLGEKMTSETEKLLLQGLYRGIGVHHRGLPKAYTELVEHLFRLRHLQVVVAGSTLALGINMPCKSVIFAADDLYLTPLEYRQMSGRAGRRGYDKLGNVIFWGVNKTKIARLLLSGLPGTPQTCSLSPTLALQTLHLASMEPQLSTLLLCRFSTVPLCDDEGISSWKHLRNMADLGVKFGLVDRKGFPTVLSRILLLAPSHDPATLHLAVLLRGGWIDRICEQVEDRPEQVHRALLLVIAHLIRPRFQSRKENCLPSLPKELQNALQDFNVLVLEMIGIAKISLRFYEGGVVLDSRCISLFSGGHDLPLYAIPPGAFRSAYLYSFFLHGSVARIHTEHGVQESDLWVDLYETSELLKQLENMIDMHAVCPQSTLAAVRGLNAVFGRRFRAIWA